MWAALLQVSKAVRGKVVCSTPEPPWLGVVIHPGLGFDPGAADWLGDLERCLTWAWLGREDTGE